MSKSPHKNRSTERAGQSERARLRQAIAGLRNELDLIPEMHGLGGPASTEAKLAHARQVARQALDLLDRWAHLLDISAPEAVVEKMIPALIVGIESFRKRAVSEHGRRLINEINDRKRIAPREIAAVNALYSELLPHYHVRSELCEAIGERLDIPNRRVRSILTKLGKMK